MTSNTEVTAAGSALLGSDIGVGLAVIDTDGRFLYVNATTEELLGANSSDLIGRTVADVRSAERAAVIAGLIAQVRQTGNPVWGERVTVHGRVWEAVFAPLQLGEDLVVSIVTFDVTEREGKVATAHAAAARQKPLTELALVALIAGDLQTLFDEAVTLVARELHLEFASILQLRSDRHALVLRAGVGFKPSNGDAVTVPAGTATLAGYTVAAASPVTVYDVSTEVRFSQSRMLAEDGVTASVSIPIQAGPKIWGVLQGHSKSPRQFPEEDVLVLRAIANVLGTAIARDASDSSVRRLAIQRRRLIREALEAAANERRRLGDSLHDDVLQHLLFAGQELASSEAGDASITQAGSSITEAVRLLRAVIGELHPVALAGRGLAATIPELIREAERPGLTTSVRLGTGISSRHDALVASAVRELLANVVKHAHASTVEVSVSANGALVVEVEDDGVGLHPSDMMQAVVDGHIGLASLVERVEASDGEIELTNRRGGTGPGTGAVIRLTLPLP